MTHNSIKALLLTTLQANLQEIRKSAERYATRFSCNEAEQFLIELEKADNALATLVKRALR